MDNRDFDGELNYSLTMIIVKQLKIEGVISDDEYKEIDAILLKKYRPVLSVLFSETYLSDL